MIEREIIDVSLHMNISGIAIPLIGIAVICVLVLAFILSGIKRCPPGKIMVIFGHMPYKNGRKADFRCYNGGCHFVFPVVQSYKLIDTGRFPVNVAFTDVVCKDGAVITFYGMLTMAVSVKKGLMEKAARYLVELSGDDISELMEKVTERMITQAVHEASSGQIFSDKNTFVNRALHSLEGYISEMGIEVVKCRFTDITLVSPPVR